MYIENTGKLYEGKIGSIKVLWPLILLYALFQSELTRSNLSCYLANYYSLSCVSKKKKSKGNFNPEVPYHKAGSYNDKRSN